MKVLEEGAGATPKEREKQRPPLQIVWYLSEVNGYSPPKARGVRGASSTEFGELSRIGG